MGCCIITAMHHVGFAMFDSKIRKPLPQPYPEHEYDNLGCERRKKLLVMGCQ